jgi:hypothetical protein
MLFLTPLASSASSHFFFNSIPLVVKTWESGLISAIRRAGVYSTASRIFSFYFFKVLTFSTSVYILF